MAELSELQGAAPGDDAESQGSARTYLAGLGYALILTVASFWASSTPLVYAPSLPVLLAVLAVAQMGVHLVFFLHISSAPDQNNNFLALLFGVFVVALAVFGSLLIISNLNHNMMPMERLLQMQR